MNTLKRTKIQLKKNAEGPIVWLVRKPQRARTLVDEYIVCASTPSTRINAQPLQLMAWFIFNLKKKWG
jgi:hypothetical protein